jgi:23S rRNA pseudouridine1911/1915/1917 synthase
MTNPYRDGIEILFNDENFLAVNKPAGLVVHYDGKTKEPSLTDWILKNYPETENVGEPLKLKTKSLQLKAIARPGIVHRIDRETSGVLIVAKNQKAFESLKSQFQNREVSKKYQAFVYGKIREDKGTISRPIGRSRKDFRRYSAQRGARGEMREAITEYRVLKRAKEVSFVELIPKTGRTHQIRVHLKAINHPVVCDSLYASKQECILGFKRLALHSLELSFRNFSEEIVTVQATYPSDFKKAIESFDSLEK